MTKIDVVNKEDQVIETKDITEVRKIDIIRCAAIILKNKEGKILLQLRAKQEENYPNHWDISAAGKLDTGETYEEGAKREMLEEIGVKTELKYITKYLYTTQKGKQYFTALFFGEYSGATKNDPKEVEKTAYFSHKEIKEMIKKEKFHPECKYILEEFVLEK